MWDGNIPWTCTHPAKGGYGNIPLDLHTSCQYRLDGLGGWGGLGGMITYLGLVYILPYGFDLGEGGMITYLGAHIRPYGFDLDRLDGLGGWGGWVRGMITYLGLAHILPGHGGVGG